MRVNKKSAYMRFIEAMSMTLTPGTRLTDPVTGYTNTVVAVTDTQVYLRCDFCQDGKVGAILSLETAARHLVAGVSTKAETT